MSRYISWGSLFSTILIIVLIERGRLSGNPLPIPFLLLYSSVVLTANLAGLRFGLLSGVFAAGFVIYAASISFGPPTLTGGTLQVIFGSLLYLGTSVLLGRTRDQKQQLLKDFVQDLHERTTALTENEARLRAILDAIPDIMFRLNRDGIHLDYYAPRKSQLWLQPAEFLGKSVTEVLPPETAQSYQDNIKRTLDQNQMQVFEYMLEFAEPRYYEARMVLAAEDEVIVIVRDITKRKEVETKEIELARQQERIQLLEEVISDLSHDIKTPLAIIKTNIYMFKKQSDPDKRLVYLNKIDTQIHRLSKLVDDILLMSRLDKGARLNFEPIDLNCLVQEIATAYSEPVQSDSPTLNFDLSDELPIVLGNETELNRAILNLIENAFNYTPTGQTITIRTTVQEAQVMLAIRDGGIGVSQADLERIFERFYRADKARNTNQGGTGLGLSIVKRIIELHNGTIDVESTLNEGSTFTVRLPLHN